MRRRSDESYEDFVSRRRLVNNITKHRLQYRNYVCKHPNPIDIYDKKAKREPFMKDNNGE